MPRFEKGAIIVPRPGVGQQNYYKLEKVGRLLVVNPSCGFRGQSMELRVLEGKVQGARSGRWWGVGNTFTATNKDKFMLYEESIKEDYGIF